MSYDSAAPPPGQRIPLFGKPSRAARRFLNGFAIVFCLWAIVGFPIMFHDPAVYFAGWGVALLVLFGYGFPTAFRSTVWLEGPVLVVRSGYATRRFDLAACRVELTADPKSQLPVLNVQDTAGPRASVLLREPKDKVLIAPQKLQALAAAITAGGAREPAGAQTAGQLAWLADNWPGTRAPQLR